MRGEGSWGAVAGGLAVLVLAGGVAALIATTSGDDDPNRVETVGSLAAPATVPPVITISSARATSTIASTAPATLAPTPTFAADTEPPTLPTPPPPPPARLEVATTDLDLGRDRSEGSIAIGNSGGQPLDWATTSDNGLVSATAGGSLGPAAQTDVTIAVNRSGLIEGEYVATVAVLGAGRAVPITVQWRVERAPVVQVGVEPAGLADGATCLPGQVDLTGFVQAAVIEESAVATVTMTWAGPGEGGSAALTASEPGTWEAPLGPLSGAGTWTVTVTASDARGNAGEGSTTLVVTACP